MMELERLSSLCCLFGHFEGLFSSFMSETEEPCSCMDERLSTGDGRDERGGENEWRK